MGYALQTPAILQIINDFIVNIMSIILTFGIILFWISLFIFALYVMYSIYYGVRSVLQS